MRACGVEIEQGGERVRGERRGRLQGAADIPAVDDEFKEASVGHGMHGENAPPLITGLVPIVGGEGGEKMMELVPGLTEPGQQVMAKTLSKSDGSLCEPQRPLPPILL